MLNKILAWLFAAFALLTLKVFAASPNDYEAVNQAAKDYIQSQHLVSLEQMKRALHPELKKRTFWQNEQGHEVILESSYQGMIDLAASYNKNGDKFPKRPKIDIQILDIDQRVASVKLTADDWIDYMHLVKTDAGEWKILNVLWQFNDVNKHASKR